MANIENPMIKSAEVSAYVSKTSFASSTKKTQEKNSFKSTCREENSVALALFNTVEMYYCGNVLCRPFPAFQHARVDILNLLVLTHGKVKAAFI